MKPANILVLGTTYTGKTYRVAQTLALSPRPFVVILHTQYDVSYLKQIPPRETLIVRLQGPTRIPPLQQLAKGRRYLYFVFVGLYGETLKGMLAQLAARVIEAAPLLLVIDEAHLFLDMRIAPENMIALLRGARHWGIDVIMVTHRIADIHPDVRSVVTHLAAFRTTAHLDQEVLYQNFLRDWELVRRVATLPQWHYLFVHLESYDLYQVAP